MSLFLAPKAQSMQWVEHASPQLISLGFYVGWVTFQLAMICPNINSKGSASPRQLHPVQTKKGGQKEVCYNSVHCVLTCKKTQELCCWIHHTLILLINPISSHPGGPNGNEHLLTSGQAGGGQGDSLLQGLQVTVRCSLSHLSSSLGWREGGSQRQACDKVTWVSQAEAKATQTQINAMFWMNV